MSQCNLMEEVNRLPSAVVKDELTFTLAQKERVNLCLVERVTDANYSYILLIIVSDYARQIRCINYAAQAKRPPKDKSHGPSEATAKIWNISVIFTLFHLLRRSVNICTVTTGPDNFEACTGRKIYKLCISLY